MTTPENPARWSPDPLGRHQYRYWDGSQWTEHVSDDGVVSTDPPVAGPAPAPEDAGYAAPTGLEPAPTATTFGATHLGAPAAGTGATAWAPKSAAPMRLPGSEASAVLVRRYGALFNDAAICLLVFGVLFFATADTHTRAEMPRVPGCHPSANDSSQVECNNRAVVTVNDTVYETEFGLFAGLSIVFTLLYFALIEGLTGGSLGKHMTGLRVVTPEGARPGFGRSLARWALFAIDGPLTLFICGIVTGAVSAGHRRLGDMAGNTYVVARADAGRQVSVRPR